MQHEQIAALDLAGHHVGEPARRQDVPQRAAHELRQQVQQLPGEIVGQHDPLVLVVSEHALPDAVQHRLPFLQQRRDLAQFQAESLPLEPPRQAQRRKHAQGEDGEEVDGQIHQRPGHLPGYRGGEEADRDLADQLAVAEDRGLADRLHAEGAVLDAHPVLAGAERLARRQVVIGIPDRLADQLRIRVGEPDSLGVGDHDERRRRAAHGRHRHALHGSVRADPAWATCPHCLLQAGLGGEALRDSQGPLLVLLVELPVQVPLHDGKAGGHGDHQDRDHHDDDLGGQALPQQPPEGDFHGFLAACPCAFTASLLGVSEV